MRDDGSLLPRDREPCLADSVNGIQLPPGFYLGRLCSSYNSLPVYEVIGTAAIGGVSTTYPSGTTTTWQPGSIISNDSTETYTSSYNGVVTSGGVLTFNPGATLNAGGIFQTGATTGTISGTVNNFSNPTAPQVTITSSSSGVLNGIVPPTDTTRAQTFTLVNNSGNTITVNNNSGSAISGGAIYTSTGAAVTWASGTALEVEYNPTLGAYVVVGGTGVSGSGGGTTTGNNYTGTSTNAYVQLFDITSTTGFLGVLAIKNTGGANTLHWRLTVTDMYSNVVSTDLGLPPGTVTVQSLTSTGFAGAYPPFKEVQLEVKDDTPGSHTGYDIWLTYSG